MGGPAAGENHAPALHASIATVAGLAARAVAKVAGEIRVAASLPPHTNRLPEAAPRPGNVDRTLHTAATRPASPRQPAAAAQRQQSVFGSVAIGFRRMPAVERLQASFREMRSGAVLSCKGASCTPRRATLVSQVATLRDRGFLDKLSGINRKVNAFVAYRRDIDNHGVVDYWSTPLETLARGSGDCEDYAILKMALLSELGIPASSMSVVVLSDERRGLYHAVLSVRTTSGFYILDNMHDRVLLDRDIPHYQPLYSASEGRGYIHGRRTTGETLVSGLRLEAIAPGEGPATLGRAGLR